MKRFSLKASPELGMLGLLICAFLFGGSSREDIASVIILRPLGVLALGWALVMARRDVWAANKAILACAAAWSVATLIQLVPLPPAIWQQIPGRELATQISLAVGQEGAWRPLSLVPWRTVNAVFAMALPLAGLLLALQIPRDRYKQIVYLLVILVWISAGLSLLQVVGGSASPFYTYRITNSDSAVGLFANRNHQAMFLAMGFPLIAASLALWPAAKEHVRLREAIGAGVALLLIPFLLYTQSRAGIVIGVIGMAMAVWVYKSPMEAAQRRRLRTTIDPRLVFGGLAAVALVGLTMAFSAANAIQRLGNNDDELRMKIWPTVWQMLGDYGLLGSGIGTFVEVYGVHEPDAFLQPSYINRAHNDWLELMLTGGLPFALILFVAIFVVARRGIPLSLRNHDSRDQVLRRLGLCLLAILALGSAYDYPVRTPAFSMLLAIAIAFAAGSVNIRRRTSNIGTL